MQGEDQKIPQDEPTTTPPDAAGGEGASGPGEGGGPAERTEPAAETPPAPNPPEPLSLEASAEPPDAGGREHAARAVADLDVCPRCGAAMRGADDVLCVRCGFNLRTLSEEATSTGSTAEDEDEGDEEVRTPLVRPAFGDVWLPGALAAFGALLVVIGALSGAAALFPAAIVVDGSVPWPARWNLVLRYPVLLALWTACGVTALVGCSWWLDRPLGDVRPAVVRILGIMALASTAAFLHLRWPWLDAVVEAAVQALVIFALGALAFRLALREALTLLALTVASFFAIVMLAHFLAWAI